MPETNFGKQLARLLVLKVDDNGGIPSGSPIKEDGMILIGVIIGAKHFVLTKNVINF